MLSFFYAITKYHASHHLLLSFPYLKDKIHYIFIPARTREVTQESYQRSDIAVALSAVRKERRTPCINIGVSVARICAIYCSSRQSCAQTRRQK